LVVYNVRNEVATSRFLFRLSACAGDQITGFYLLAGSRHMKRIVALVAALVVVAAAASANAAEPTKSGLSKMGLPGLKVMSDSEGSKVRGTFALIYGESTSSSASVSFTSASAATSTNGYVAGGANGAAAVGGNTSTSSAATTGFFSTTASASGGSFVLGFGF
jgi:hypothetical protein